MKKKFWIKPNAFQIALILMVCTLFIPFWGELSKSFIADRTISIVVGYVADFIFGFIFYVVSLIAYYCSKDVESKSSL